LIFRVFPDVQVEQVADVDTKRQRRLGLGGRTTLEIFRLALSVCGEHFQKRQVLLNEFPNEVFIGILRSFHVLSVRWFNFLLQ
jgi:hypothetical protein